MTTIRLICLVPWALLTTLWVKEGIAQIHQTDPYELLDQLGQALSVVEREYHEPPDQSKLLSGALTGMVSELDPHSAFFDRRHLELFEGSTTGRFGGIGVEVEFADGEIIVIAPVEGSPADRAGIQPGDRIVALDGVPLGETKPNDIVLRMRGEIGSELRLSVRGEKSRTIREVVLIREQIAVASVRATLMKGGVAYLRIKAFQDGTHTELLKELGRLRRDAGQLNGVILDLRNNPGGLVREAAAVGDEFLTGGVIFSTRHRGKTLRVERARRGGAFARGALVVLVNEYSASAAELVAGALRDHGRARLVGAHTFGKGSVQTVLPLGHGGALKLTTALYYTPSGETVQAKGIAPHVAIDPGYVAGTLKALRESDLDGHLDGSDPASAPPGSARQALEGAPPTTRELHLGVARKVPSDPTSSADLALRTAYRMVLGFPPSLPRAESQPGEPSPASRPE